MFHIYEIYCELTERALHPTDLEVFFQLLLLSEFLEVATCLCLLSLLGKLSAEGGAGDGGRQRGEHVKERWRERTRKTNLKILTRQIT